VGKDSIQPSRTRRCHGAAALLAGWNDRLLAGMGIPWNIHGWIIPDLSLSPEKESCAPQASLAWRADGGKTENTKDHYGVCVNRIRLSAHCAGTRLPFWLVGGSCRCHDCRNVLVAVGFCFVFRVYKENTFTSSTIEVAENQTVISTGPYALVRHPLYASSFLYLVGMPLALGSYWGLLGVLFMFPFLIWRLLDEERFLAKNLPGYSEYQKKVIYRLVPYVW
jgi:protein-S-isoprenylcysteine O-methyltransferase Ste14